ncbi:amphi-Trp domain-containing protein [Halocatena pleomorpha]|uniref:Amphi-Trp domain-containing protein n=1 Tax=Halocatena pleomorpha TaxID=1785090 RepID=A0A3P3R779_9EURY|nr:amphi-Trp domain-containing protein [Halocatena pleomorpha]RRJ29234.1 amphi-Trp domain-containing protein [Halocatena pleomorpha]
MEETLFVTERRQSRTEIASHLRSVADKLDSGEALTLSNGEESVTLDVPEQAEFEIEVERETGDGEPELSLEFEIEWSETGKSSGFVIE